MAMRTERRELSLLEDALERLGRRLPRPLRLLADEVVKRRADGHDDVAPQRVIFLGSREGGALRKHMLGSSIGEHGLGSRGGGGSRFVTPD